METIVDLTTVFVLLVFISSFLKAKNDKSKHINLYEYVTCQPIGSNTHNAEIELLIDDSIQDEIIKPVKTRKTNRRKKKKKNTKEIVNTNLYNDCDLAMKSLKVDAKERKYLLNREFSKDNKPKDIQDFISRAFHK